ncbi:hypothetical protein OOZ15_05440 [Galbibacter sp. EGI 63066]|uniref:hypothetical protein n=1 Tax=Galbibacter sp. EGI 63066 TaxID=2993559 RepID=UPI002248DBD2|nr:hypothetical protein [Galbibacter sp. EGI 63066]MCX2679380.1 hypothetical protein [Galbibacter sp. EGI 63066]
MNKKEHKIIAMLARGYTQREVSEWLIKKGYSSVSLSSIEKLLAKLRKQYKVRTTIQLFVVLTKKGLI